MTDRAWQPFGQVPAYADDEVTLFESGAIVLHIAARSPCLAPADAAGRARVTAWVLAALNSMEPHAQSVLQLEGHDEPARQRHRAELEARLDQRLAQLATWLGDADDPEDRFTAGDLIMTTVLRELVDSGALARHAALDALRIRCEARPSFARAKDAQMKPFREHAPA